MYRATICVALLFLFAPSSALSQSTPGLWTGDFSMPHGCAWSVTNMDTADSGEVYLSLQGHVCGQSSGALFVYDPVENDFDSVGDFFHETAPFVFINGIHADGTDVYVGGTFTHVDGLEVNGVARLDTTTGQWSALANGKEVGITDGSWVADFLSTEDDIFVAGTFSEIGGVATNGVARWDRAQEQWHALGDGITDPQGSGRTLAMNDGALYLGGTFDEVGNQPANNIAAWNGSQWSALGDGVNGPVLALATSGSSVYAGGSFNEAGIESAQGLAVWNGTDWQAIAEIGDVGFFSPGIDMLLIENGVLYLGGFFNSIDTVPARNIARMDLSTGDWSALGAGEGGGLGRSAIPTLLSRGVMSMAVSGNQLYAGGDIPLADGQAVNNIARFDLLDEEWSPIGKNMGQGISGQESWGTGFTSQGLIVAGPISQTGLVPGFGVARRVLAENEWSTFAANDEQFLTSPASEVLGLGDEVFIGGNLNFKISNPDDPELVEAVTGIMRWDESTDDWERLVDVNTEVSGVPSFSSMAGHDENLYVSGTFETAGGHAANNIARWNIPSQTWSALGDGLDARATAIVIDTDGLLYAAGPFTMAGEEPANGLAVWNPTTENWAALGGGISNSDDSDIQANAIAITADGDLLVGGQFDTAGGESVNNLARWDGSNWHDFGDGLTHDDPDSLLIRSIVVAESGEIFIGGRFTHADGLAVNNLTRWDGDQWTMVGASENSSGVEGQWQPQVFDLALEGPDLMVSGRFSKAGGQVASHFGHFVRDLGGCDLDISIDVEQLGSPSNADPDQLIMRTSAGVLYTVEVRNLGQNSASGVVLSMTADPEPTSVDWTCQPIPGTNAVCPQESGSGLPNLVFNLPQQSGLRFEILMSVDSDEAYSQQLTASASAEQVFDGDNTESEASSTILVNDIIFLDRFQ